MKEAYTLIKEAGLKLTPRRREMIILFSTASTPLSPQEVLDRLKLQFRRCGLPGVYRNLETLAECGVLFRVVNFGRERSYALCCMSKQEEHHHHHIICISCGKIGQVDACGYQKGMVIDGFRLVSHVVQLKGICAACASEETEASG
ncbi:MAG: transcriptional repressor [Chlorobiaceae bacterium]|jgi:Fur family transcriptional regulator, ferric uptake regulator|nr:transcriptional repressor [Chlorobiaceae bacterium]NTV16942.1 transcriptional repressor [Chlorobiaceae bacterium]